MGETGNFAGGSALGTSGFAASGLGASGLAAGVSGLGSDGFIGSGLDISTLGLAGGDKGRALEIPDIGFVGEDVFVLFPYFGVGGNEGIKESFFIGMESQTSVVSFIMGFFRKSGVNVGRLHLPLMVSNTRTESPINEKFTCGFNLFITNTANKESSLYKESCI
jgi:hypothetical protein